jgi:ParB family chromosome partitioning protein
MTNSTSVQTTHTSTQQAAVSLKTQAGSPKPDIAKNPLKKQGAVVKLTSTAKPVLMQLSIGQLIKSTLNVRKSKVSKEDDEQLYASILAHGVLQNVLVEPANEQGLYPVLGGGRRLKQLLKLVKNQKLSLSTLVPAKVLSAEEVSRYATELSLTENFVRANMHPVDEFQAFADMVNKGASVAEVAARFGVKEKFVQQRMKLSLVAPVVLRAYQKGDISLDIVMVFTLASIEQQIEVWEQAGNRHYSEPQFRNMLKEKAVKSDNYLVKYVGKGEYTKAGGVITTDLFSDAVFFDDKPLLDSLATAKLEVEAAKLIKQGWKWTHIKLVSDYEETKGFGAIEQNDKGAFNADEMALAGCMLVLQNWGENPVKVYKGLVSKADKKALALLKHNAQPETEAGQAPEATEKLGYSGALNDDLKAQRLIIAKHALMSAPTVALNTLHFSVCVNTFGDGRYGLSPLYLDVKNTTCHPKQGALSDNKAAALIASVKNGLDLSWLALSTASERFSAFCLLDIKEKEKLVACATAMMLEASIGQSHEAAEAVITTLDVKWSNYWRPNADTFFKRVSQSCLMDLAAPVMSAQWVTQAALLKKKDLAAQVDGLVNGDGQQLNEKQKAYFSTWVPTGF